MFVVETFRLPPAGAWPPRPPPPGRSHSANEWPCSEAGPTAACARGSKLKRRVWLAGVGFDLQRAVVLPGDVEARRHPHQAGRAVGLAAAVREPWSTLSATLRAVVVQRHAGVVALRRRHHAPPPVLVDDRHPVAGQVDRRRRPRRRRPRRRRGWTAARPCWAAERNRARHQATTRIPHFICRPPSRVSSSAARAATQISVNGSRSTAAGCAQAAVRRFDERVGGPEALRRAVSRPS